MTETPTPLGGPAATRTTSGSCKSSAPCTRGGRPTGGKWPPSRTPSVSIAPGRRLGGGLRVYFHNTVRDSFKPLPPKHSILPSQINTSDFLATTLIVICSPPKGPAGARGRGPGGPGGGMAGGVVWHGVQARRPTAGPGGTGGAGEGPWGRGSRGRSTRGGVWQPCAQRVRSDPLRKQTLVRRYRSRCFFLSLAVPIHPEVESAQHVTFSHSLPPSSPRVTLREGGGSLRSSISSS